MTKSPLLALAGLALAAPAAAQVKLNGAGATFPNIIYQDWMLKYNQTHPDVQLNYQSIGSGGGIRQFSDATVDFGASDAPMKDSGVAAIQGNEMARQARSMLSGALDAFVRGDGVLGRDICRRDDSVDALHHSVFRILLTHMMADPHIIGAAMDLFLVSRNLERVADLATNIAEGVVFVVEGKTIKHHAEG